MGRGRGRYSQSLASIFPGPQDPEDASHCPDGPGWEEGAVSTGGWLLRSVPRAENQERVMVLGESP